ncbi:MAG: hypothetical protein NZV14_18430 [Bryobacteraceae bacterium]|nr:hypothetical protein [Bryobacteraceae bacterium]MDW8380144.1 hypothetical protein [Bryobacterales bacterium]
MLLRRQLLVLTGLTGTLPVRGDKAPTRPVRVERLYQTPGPKPNGLQATKDGLWILDQGDNRAYLVDYSTGKPLRILDTESKAGSGITFDGEALWLASTYSCEIIRADARSGKTLAKYPSPGAGPVHWTEGRKSPLAPAAPPSPAPSPRGKPAASRPATGAHGLEWRQGKLYIANPPSRRIYRMEPNAWKIEFEFPTAGNRPHGLGWEGKWLWCVDSNDNAFYKHDPETGQIHEKIQLADSDPLPHGMTIWNGWLWYCDDVGLMCRFRLRA